MAFQLAKASIPINFDFWLIDGNDQVVNFEFWLPWVRLHSSYFPSIALTLFRITVRKYSKSSPAPVGPFFSLHSAAAVNIIRRYNSFLSIIK